MSMSKSVGEKADGEPRVSSIRVSCILSLLGAALAWSALAAPPVDLDALRRAVADGIATYQDDYPNGSAYLERIEQYAKQIAAPGFSANESWTTELAAFQREVLLANPIAASLDRILVIKRNAQDPALGLPANWQGNCSLPQTKYDNEIAVLTRDCVLTTLYKPEQSFFIGDLDLHFDVDRLLFSMPGSHQRSQIWEIRTDGAGLRQVTLGEEDDVDNYDACYLPDGRIVFDSTACYEGIPCVSGSDSVANLYLMNADGTGVRQLCFDQDHTWCPAVLNNGRILYTRWEYADLPHSNTRLLFHMNPDGTGQMEYYGSNSYWPTAVMYARPVPGHPTKVAAIVTGHHGVARMGELVILDPAEGRREAEGAVQRIPGYGKPVEAIIRDNLADDSWPKFLHPYPLNEKYILVACKPTPESLWGIYLVDVFDNLLLLREEPGYALLEPIPLRSTSKPPAIPDKIKPGEKEATVYLADVYAGPGLEGIPRGTAKSLRVIAYVFAYRKTGGMLGVIGMDGPWDIKRILGTVPVEPDGSALFRVPANTPIAVQPLDERGRALQLMRSWFTAMPGETVSCVGCHEQQNSSPPARSTTAARRAPDAIAPWHGPARGFNFAREVQPVLDLYCLSCHDGKTNGLPDLRGTENIKDWKSLYPGSEGGEVGGRFSVAYAELHRYVRRPGIESNYHLLAPMEYHASTTELVQLLEHGHREVVLDDESWDRLYTWIDLNTPFHGTWLEIYGQDRLGKTIARRRELLAKYAGLDVDYEAIPETVVELTPPAPGAVETIPPGIVPAANEAAPQPAAHPAGTPRTVDLGEGLTLELVYLPAGTFDIGGNEDAPPVPTTVEKPFWMGRFEVTNEQYARFDPSHDSGVEAMHAYQFGIHGYPLNEPRQPVVRITWKQATEFCRWLSERTGETFSLPTEMQWEHACRAGTSTPFWFGDLDTDFAAYANLGDVRLREFARNTYIQVNLLESPNRYDDWIPKDERFDDRSMLSSAAGRYQPNAWGLHDMHGNVWEWTQSPPGPAANLCVARGGSWYDRPYRATAAYRIGYQAWQPVFNVGFRVLCNAAE
jgi:formylglycine-generating enzyme required for sulfatase activity